MHEKVPFAPGGRGGWRVLSESDLDRVVALAARVAAHDGGLPATATGEFLRRRYVGLGEERRAFAVGAFAGDRLVACGARRPVAEGTMITGLVDPDHRQRGLGGTLFALLTEASGGASGPLLLETESLKPHGEAFLAARGLVRTFAEDVLRLGPDTAPPAVPLPGGITPEEWSDTNRADFHAAYRASFADRPGFPDPTLHAWTVWLVDDTFLPGCSLLARTADGTPVAFVTCAEEYVVQLGVAPGHRRTGLGRALATAALHRLRAHGHGEVYLDVNTDNPASAALFRGLGFAPLTRRARFAGGGRHGTAGDGE
ncbi:GNAT family N-acetyltransferase [Streptomyces sp. NPDC020807]|uniref:GNAT family N-acetyltransferase n=1 Tax=Streptomyces sp. NPDC020807 TaxID=3155119 RepID=UPI0033C79DFE